MKRMCGASSHKPKKSKQSKQSKQSKPPNPLSALPQLPDELWRIISKLACEGGGVDRLGTMGSVATVSCVRLVRKLFARTLHLKLVWQSFHALLDGRAAKRVKLNLEDDANPEMDSRDTLTTTMIRGTQDQGDLFILRFYLEMCASTPGPTIQTALDGLAVVRSMFGPGGTFELRGGNDHDLTLLRVAR